MTAPGASSTPTQSTTPSWRDGLAVYTQPRVLIVLLLGFSSGLPLPLSGSTLLVWMRESGVDLVSIGLFAMVGTPYTLKCLWAPLVDALHVPFFTRAFGRRGGWLVFSQLLLIGAILLLALTDPARSPLFVALGALLVATMSSTQDIVVDAFRVESLPESEQAAGMASYVAAYRIGMLISTAGALFIVSGFESTGIRRGRVLQAIANLSFSWLALVGVNQWALAFAITAENFTSAIGTVIFVAYLSALCRNPLHTATQYALLTALAAVGRTYLSSGAGYVAAAAGWVAFFAICAAVAIPSLMLLVWLQRSGHFASLAEPAPGGRIGR